MAARKLAELRPEKREKRSDDVFHEPLDKQGEVLVNVLFKASGEPSVLDVVHGLGHGLDEAAVRAQQIRFKPALRAGQAVDWTATVHIIFQLAF